MLRPGLYRNAGAPWTRTDGTRIERGSEFEPTADERARKAYKLECIGPVPSDPLPMSVNVEDYAVGGGWYMIDGEKVQGRDKAEEVLSGSHN